MAMTQRRRVRAEKVLELRSVGTPTRAVADALGVSHTQVIKDERALCAELRSERDVPGYRDLLVRTAEIVKATFAEVMLDGYRPMTERLKAADRVLRADARIAKLLGLDAPDAIALMGEIPSVVVEIVRADRGDADGE